MTYDDIIKPVQKQCYSMGTTGMHRAVITVN